MTEFERHYLVKGIIIEVVLLVFSILMQLLFKFIPGYNNGTLMGNWLVVAHDLIMPLILIFGALLYMAYYRKKLSEAQNSEE